MKTLFYYALAVMALMSCGCLAPITEEAIPDCIATLPAERLNIPWWQARLTEKEALATKQYDTVLIGDSITHNWDEIAPDLQQQYFGEVLNLGFSGDQTQDVLWRIARIDWEVVQPKRIMLMIGTNNTGMRPEGDPKETFYGIAKIVQTLRSTCPQAKITLLAIFPRSLEHTEQRRVTNDVVNMMLPSLADEQQVYFRNINVFYLMPDNRTLNRELMPDLLHPNKEGHRLWAAAVMHEFMNDYTAPAN